MCLTVKHFKHFNYIYFLQELGQKIGKKVLKNQENQKKFHKNLLKFLIKKINKNLTNFYRKTRGISQSLPKPTAKTSLKVKLNLLKEFLLSKDLASI
jgi:hypothetical protein